ALSSFDSSTCGHSKGCFLPSDPECYQGCNGMKYSWLQLDNNLMQIELTVDTANPTDGFYVAIGFSDDDLMRNMSTIECSSLVNGTLSMKFSYNYDSTTNVRIPGEETIRDQYFTEETAVFQDGQVFCSAVVNVQGSPVSDKVFIPFDLFQIFTYKPSQEYFLLLSTGSTTSNELTSPSDAVGSIYSTKLAQYEEYFDASSCGIDKECVLPTECYRGCNGMGFSYKMMSDSLMRIELFSVATDNNQYIAVGFSDDDHMGKDYVIECSALTNQKYSLKFSYNDASPANVRIPDEEKIRSSYFLNNMVMSSDAQLYCTAVVNVSGWSGSDKVFRLNPTQSYYLLLASGNTDAKGLTIHKHNYVSSPRLLTDNGNQTGLDNVIECSALTSAQLSMKFSYNPTTKNVRIPGEENIRSSYFRNENARFSDGVMYCTAVVTVSGWTGNSEVFTYDPKMNYYLFLATGQAVSSGLTQHTKTAISTPRKLSDYSVDASGTSGMSATVKQRLTKAHAILMLISWFFFIPTAAMFARFLRASWPTVKPGGLLIWFHVHRTSNLIGIAFNVASFICILTANNWDWTGPGSQSSKWGKTHSMIGIFALCLAWLQPFVSAMRGDARVPTGLPVVKKAGKSVKKGQRGFRFPSEFCPQQHSWIDLIGEWIDMEIILR
ncbi:DOMON domain protein, partial [Teladorsagia circumcincta]